MRSHSSLVFCHSAPEAFGGYLSQMTWKPGILIVATYHPNKKRNRFLYPSPPKYRYKCLYIYIHIYIYIHWYIAFICMYNTHTYVCSVCRKIWIFIHFEKQAAVSNPAFRRLVWAWNTLVGCLGFLSASHKKKFHSFSPWPDWIFTFKKNVSLYTFGGPMTFVCRKNFPFKLRLGRGYRRRWLKVSHCQS